MRNILLCGKLLAGEASASYITLEHIKQALTYLHPINKEEYERVCATLDIQRSDQVKHQRFSKEELENAASQPRLPYDQTVVEMLEKLERLSIYPSNIITTPYVAIEGRSAPYHDIVSSIVELKALLKSKIFDQDSAIESVTDTAMRMSWSGVSDRPRAIFSFLGPAATGKTYMAKLLGQGLQGYKTLNLDMAQFSSEKEGFGLVGLRKGFTDATVGQLTEFVNQNPKSIIVLDELEKSHTRVQSTLLRLFSEGRLKDEFSGEDIDFRNTVIVLTSNLGSSLYSSRTFAEQVKANPHQAREHLLHAIRQETKIEDGHEVPAMTPEMVSRLSQGSVVLFNKLSVDALTHIAKDQLESERNAFEARLGLAVSFSRFQDLLRLIVLGFAPNFDTREMKARLTDLIYDPITDYLIDHLNTEITQVDICIDDATKLFIDDQDLVKLPQQLAVKHQRIYFEKQFELSGTTLSMTCHNARIEKLSRKEDFEDASAIQVDLPSVSFNDIAGHSQIKDRLRETVNLVRHREQLEQQGINAPRGVLLYGVPGTGKTMLAKAFANEAGLPFIACAGNDLLNEGFIRKLFARAREYAPALIFIDEIDALPRRGSAGPQADALVNRMLVEIDGFGGGSDAVFIIAATNRKELIDPAILRSGRIDLHFEVPQLDKLARRWFVERITNNSLFEPNMNIDQLIMLTAGFSGADLEKVRREVTLSALREGLTSVSEKYVIEQINTQKYGAPLSLEDSKEFLSETAYHEAAHAVISRVLLPERRIEQVTVVARADFLGMVSYDNDQQHDYTRDFFFNLSCVALAGRAAQVKQFGQKGLDAGASSDLKQAANYAWHAIVECGMDEELYNLSIHQLTERFGHSLYSKQIEQRISSWMDQATEQTESLIEKHWQQIEAVAQAVLHEEIINATTLKQLMETNDSGH